MIALLANLIMKIRKFGYHCFCYVALVFSTLLFTGCSADLDEYKQTSPSFDLFDYFVGETQAWGMVQDYTQKQTRRFEVKLQGQIEGNTLTLVEDFIFDDGEETQRIWVIERLENGEYLGKADDIIGTAKGREEGNALHWRYDFQLAVGESSYNVYFDDWLYRQDEKHVFNITSIQKFGIEVGKVTLFFSKQ